MDRGPDHGCGLFWSILFPVSTSQGPVHKTGPLNTSESKEDSSLLISIQNKTNIRDEWQHVEITLLDECSMLSGQLLCEVDQSLRYTKERLNEWFGGIIMIFAGDFFQFPPVMGSSLCKPISLYGKSNDDELKKRFGQRAWKTIDTVIELVEQQRMKLDSQYADAVLRLRTQDCTPDDIDLFNSQLMMSVTHPNGVDMSDAENYGLPKTI
jgi:hypothetical protein